MANAKADAAKDFSDALSLAERDAKDNIALAGQINKQSTAADAQTEMTDRAATERDHTADRGAESNDHAASGHHTTETPDPPKPGMLDVTHMLDRPAVVFWGEANYVDFEILGDMYRPSAQQQNLPTGSYGNHRSADCIRWTVANGRSFAETAWSPTGAQTPNTKSIHITIRMNRDIRSTHRQ